MPDASPAQPTGLPATLFPTLLDQLPSGVMYYHPLLDAAGAVVDFTFAYLNAAAQRLLGLPAQPATTYLGQWPGGAEADAFAFHRDAFLAGGPAERPQGHQADGADAYYQLHACRVAEGLLVSLVPVAAPPAAAVAEALRASQIREQAALAEAQAALREATRQRALLHQILRQAPAYVATLEGPRHVYSFFNESFSRVLAQGRARVGSAFADLFPELVEQGFLAVLDGVYASGQPFQLPEVKVVLRDPFTYEERTTYVNVVYQPLRDEQGRTHGLLAFAVDTTEQVRARQQVQDLNEELAVTNEELRASNEEYLLANTALSETQQQLRQLNEELEARVQQRTQDLVASHQAAAALQVELLAAARRQVRQREDLYQVFAQTSALVVLLRGPQHHYEYANPACEQLLPGRFLPGRPITEGVPEVEAQGFLALLDHVYQTGETYLGNELPFAIEAGEGQPPRTLYFNFSYQAYREQGQTVGILVFAYEVTEVVLARQQRETQQHLLETVFAQAPTAIWVAQGPTCVFELVNPLMARLLGHAPAQLLGRPYLEALPELAAQGVPELLARAWQGETVFVQEHPVRLAHYAPGETSYFSFVLQPLRNAQGLVDRVASVGVDMTSQVRARQQVQDLNEELAAINEELTATNEELHESNTSLTRTNADLDNFIYTASHDLKAPISNIEGLLHLLPEVLPAAVREDELVSPILSRMQESAERFKRTIGHLTDVSKLQAEFAQPAQPVRLATIIEEVHQDLLLPFTEAQARLEVAVDDCQPRVFSAKNLRSIIYNLLSNALKYRHPDRPPLVRIACAPREGALVLTVRDNGLGLSEAQQQRVFQLFQRLHTHVEGTGVGLHMVKKIVEQAGGTITLRSQEDVGTTFTLTFPA